MKTGTGIAVAGLLALLLGLLPVPGEAQSPLNCGPFTREPLTPPRPRENAHARTRFEQINSAVKAQAHRVLFLGDSLTEHFDAGVWQDHMAPRGVLNAGISGDRTDHLRWRLEHGNLDGPPQAVAADRHQ
jgi:hypothetical protein